MRVPLQPFSIISRLRSALDSLCFALLSHTSSSRSCWICSVRKVCSHHRTRQSAGRTKADWGCHTRAAKTTKRERTLLSEHDFVCVCSLFSFAFAAYMAGLAKKTVFLWQYFLKLLHTLKAQAYSTLLNCCPTVMNFFSMAYLAYFKQQFLTVWQLHACLRTADFYYHISNLDSTNQQSTCIYSLIWPSTSTLLLTINN